MSEAADSKKRTRKHYGAPRYKKQRIARELEVGMKGILITCNLNERKCTAEAYNLLNEYAENLYGPEKVRNGATSVLCLVIQKLLANSDT